MLRVLVTNIKGGCGKTTIATNLAAAFAAGGFVTGLAEVDRQKSSLSWLKLRDGRGQPIAPLDWRKEAGQVPAGMQRVIIDAPANLRMKHVDELIRGADLVVVPVLASVFDEGSTERFLAKLEELKPIRKGRASVALVANRLRPRSKAAQRLEGFLARLGQPIAARLSDRAVYGELAVQGLGVFDVDGHLVRPVRDEWRPLLQAVEDAAAP
jgi:chromosome partitioning protein